MIKLNLCSFWFVLRGKDSVLDGFIRSLLHCIEADNVYEQMEGAHGSTCRPMSCQSRPLSEAELVSSACGRYNVSHRPASRTVSWAATDPGGTFGHGPQPVCYIDFGPTYIAECLDPPHDMAPIAECLDPPLKWNGIRRDHEKIKQGICYNSGQRRWERGWTNHGLYQKAQTSV